MKAITLHQVWASLIAIGVKTIETRGWPTEYRGMVVIHAGSNKKEMKNSLEDAKYRGWMKNAGYVHTSQIPLGCAVATAMLVDCVPTEVIKAKWHLSPMEYRCGDYSDGRYGFVLDEVKSVLSMPVKGALGFWVWPDDVKLVDNPYPRMNYHRTMAGFTPDYELPVLRSK